MTKDEWADRMQSSAEQEKKLRERLAEERKWAAQEAERTEGMGLQKLAQKVGTSQQNVKNILTRVPKYSKYVAPIDDVFTFFDDLKYARLLVPQLVEITGVGPRFENSYFVTHAQHRFNRSSGYVTDFRAESAYFGG